MRVGTGETSERGVARSAAPVVLLSVEWSMGAVGNSNAGCHQTTVTRPDQDQLKGGGRRHFLFGTCILPSMPAMPKMRVVILGALLNVGVAAPTTGSERSLNAGVAPEQRECIQKVDADGSGTWSIDEWLALARAMNCTGLHTKETHEVRHARAALLSARGLSREGRVIRIPLLSAG